MSNNYTKTDKVEFEPDEKGTKTPVKEVAVANCKKLNMRSMPSVKSSIVTVLTDGTRLRVLDPTSDLYNEWIHVETEDKKPLVGYVLREYVRVI